MGLPVIRDHHHRIALLLALGKKPVEVARELGYSSARLSQLRDVAGFEGLVQKYQRQADSIEFRAFEQVSVIRAAIEEKCLQVIRERLEDDPESFTTRELLEISADAADRLGRSKVSRSESVSMQVDLADSLAEARRREIRLSAVPEPPGTEGGLASASSPAPN